MLQSLRDKMKGAMAAFIVAIMVIPLVLFGVDRIFLNTTSDPAVADVNGDKITEVDLSREIDIQKQQLRERFGDGVPESFLSDDNLRSPAIEELIGRKLWLQAAKEGHMEMPTQRIDQLLADAPQFQRDGKFSPELFRFQANNSGYTSNEFREVIRQDRTIAIFANSVASNGFVTEQQLQQLAALSNQTRNFYYLTIPVEPIRAAVEIEDAQIQAYYDDNQQQFQTPEQVVVDYLELSLADIATSVEVTEEELREQYQQEIADFEGRPEYHAAHILIEPKDDGSEQTILQEVQDKLAAGEDFAALAGQYSDDFGSKDSGGDLGFTSGDTFPEEFETALAELAVGATSAPVETDAGFHIIKKLEQRNIEPPSFEDQRARIEIAVKESKASGNFLEVAQQLEDLTYSAPDLNEAAQALGLAVKTSQAFARSGGFGIAGNPAVVEAAFNSDILVEGHNSHAIEVGDNHLVVLRVKEHLPQRVQDLAEVKTQITDILLSQEATIQLQVQGEIVEQAVRGGKSIEEIAKENGYEWQVSLDTTRNSPQIRREVVNKVFAMTPPQENETLVDGLITNAGDYVVLELTGVKAGDYSTLSDAEKTSMRQRMEELEGASAYGAYLANLRGHAKIEIKE